jgi:hypothetical protein
MTRAEHEMQGDDGARDTLLRLVAEALTLREREGEPGVERICSEHPDYAHRIRQRILLLRNLGLLEAWTGVVFRDDSPPRPRDATGPFREDRRDDDLDGILPA